MKQITFLVVMLFACAAIAQAPKEPAKKEAPKPEAVKEAAKPEPMKEAAKPAAEPAKQAAAAPKKPRRWNEDARHCLDLTSNNDIIKCAEEFL